MINSNTDESSGYLKMKIVYLTYLTKPLKGIMIFDGDQVKPSLVIAYLKGKVLLSKIWIMMKHYVFEVTNSQN